MKCLLIILKIIYLTLKELINKDFSISIIKISIIFMLLEALNRNWKEILDLVISLLGIFLGIIFGISIVEIICDAFF